MLKAHPLRAPDPPPDPIAVVAKAAYGDFPSVEARQDAAIGSALTAAARAWQQTVLRDASIHHWLYKVQPWVNTCVELIAQEATADAYHVESAKGATRKGRQREKGPLAALKAWLSAINPQQSLDTLLRGIYRDLQINGNWYGRVQYAGSQPVAVYRVDFRTISPDPPGKDSAEIASYSWYRNGRNDLSPVPLPAREILHLKINDRGENGCGLSPLEPLDSTLALDVAASSYNRAFFENGAKAGDIYGLEESLTEDQIERERLYLTNTATKPDQSFVPLFLSGKIRLIRDGSAMRRDMDFIELRKWDREEVCAVYSVPISLVTGTVGQLGGNGKEQDRIMFREAVIQPLQKLAFEDLNLQLVQARMGLTTLRLVAPKIAGIRLDLVDAAMKMAASGAYGNEIRRLLHLPDDPTPGMDDVPLFLRGARTSLAGSPGDEGAVIFTDQGAFSAVVQDPTAKQVAKQRADMAGQVTGQGPGQVPPDQAAPIAGRAAQTAVKKAKKAKKKKGRGR